MKRGKQIMILWAGLMLLSGAMAYGDAIVGCQDPNSLFGLSNGVLINYDSATHGAFRGEPDISSCGDSDGVVLWLKFTPIQNGLYAFDFDRTSEPEGMIETFSVFTECSSYGQLRCTDITETGSDYFEWCLQAGTTYLIRVGRYVESSLEYNYDFTLVITRIGGAVNDLCADQVTLSAGVKYEGDTLCATGTDISSCGFNDSKDVWHVFTPTQSGKYQFEYHGPNSDPNSLCLSVFTQCDTASSEVLCSDPCSYLSNGFPKLCLQAGTAYYVRIAGQSDTTLEYYDVTINKLHDAAPNDDCANAAVLTESVLYNGTNVCATGTASIGCAGGNFYQDTKDVWHVFTPTTSGEYRFEAHWVSDGGLDFRMGMQVYGTCTDPCDILACTDPCSIYNQNYPELCLTAGVPYYVRVAGNEETEGDYSLKVVKIGGVPANDECVNAIEMFELDPELFQYDTFDMSWAQGDDLWEGLTFGDNHCATGVDLTHDGMQDTRDVWYMFWPEKPGMYFIFFSATFPGTVAVYDTCPTGKTEIAYGTSCEFYTGPKAVSVQSNIENDFDYDYGGWCGVQVQLSNCQPYLIRVAGERQSMGEFGMGIVSLISPLDNDECDQAYEIEPDTVYLGTTLGATGEDITPCGQGDISDVWFRFDAETSGTYTFECRSDMMYGTNDVTFSVFDSCDGNWLAYGEPETEQVTFAAQAGSEYLIRLAGKPNGLTGAYAARLIASTNSLSPLCIPEPIVGDAGIQSVIPQQTNGPSNDACGNAALLTTGTPYNGSFCGAIPSELSEELYFWFRNLESNRSDVWHTFTAPEDGIYRIVVDSYQSGMTLSVHRSCIGQPIAYTNFLYGMPIVFETVGSLILEKEVSPLHDQTYLHAEAGVTYLIRLGTPNVWVDAILPLGEQIPEMYCNYSITIFNPPADCTVQPFTLTVQISGDGFVDPNGGTYDPNTVVPLQAAAASGWHFVGWQGTDDDSSTSTSNEVTMYSDRLVTAIFEQDAPPEPPVPLDLFNVVITAGPNGSVNPEGESLQPEGKVLIVTATPAPGYRVKGWTGLPDFYGRAAIIQLLVDSDKFVHVEFELIPEEQPALYQLTYLIVGGQGVIPQTSGEYQEEVVVPLSASPAENYRIKEWNGTDNDGTTDNSNAVTMTGDKVVTVEFEPVPVNLTLQVIGKGGTTPMTSGPRDQGSLESLLVSLQAGYRVFQWNGSDDDATKNASNQVTMDTDKAVSVEIAKSVSTKKLAIKLSKKDGKDTIKASGEFEAELEDLQNADSIRVRVFDNLTSLFEESIPFNESQLKKERKFSYKNSVKTGDPEAVSALKFDLQKNTISITIKNLNLPDTVEGPVYVVVDIGDYIGLAEVGSDFVKIKGKN